jgi:hypothetical protein
MSNSANKQTIASVGFVKKINELLKVDFVVRFYPRDFNHGYTAHNRQTYSLIPRQ